MVVHIHLSATRALLGRMKGAAGQKKKLPFWFGTSYPGRGREKLGLSVEVARSKDRKIALTFRWFLARSDPPSTFGRYSELADCMRESVGKIVDASIGAVFVYKGERFASLFKPTRVVESVPLFDEIVGVTGVKKDTSGKQVYRMELSFDDNELNHSISFVHSFDWSEESIKQILEKARSISALALVSS